MKRKDTYVGDVHFIPREPSIKDILLAGQDALGMAVAPYFEGIDDLLLQVLRDLTVCLALSDRLVLQTAERLYGPSISNT